MSKRVNNKKGKLGRSPKFNKHIKKQMTTNRTIYLKPKRKLSNDD